MQIYLWNKKNKKTIQIGSCNSNIYYINLTFKQSI